MTATSAYDDKRYFLWLAELLSSDHFDIVVPVERKATAILRALLDLTPEIKCDCSWNRVLSSEALPYLPQNWLDGQRILVFNEMIHRGHSTKTTIEAIEKNTPGAEKLVKTAAFVVHSEFDPCEWRQTQESRVEPDALSPDYAMLRGVSDELYGIIRERLIDILQNKGALLLDTEHLETTFSFTLPPRRFLDALRTFGVPVEYENEDGAGFPGVTVRLPVVADLERLRASLPKGSNLTARAPQTIRMVRRGPKNFAFIPIWYPPVPQNAVKTVDDWETAPSYAQRALSDCPAEKLPELAFHLTSLITGVELVQSIWAGLAPFVGKGVEPDMLHGTEAPESPLGHLRALYPLLDFDALEDALDSAISTYRNRTISNRVHKAAKWKPKGRKNGSAVSTIIRADDKCRSCRRVLVEMIRKQRRFSIGEDWFDSDECPAPTPGFAPFTWSEFWEAGEKLDLSKALRSIIMDTVIDNAVLKTTHTVAYDNGNAFIVRAYEPDSEFAREALERMAHGAQEVVLNG